MNGSPHFKISRFWLLLKMELFRSFKGTIILTEIVLGFCFFGSFLIAPVFEDIQVYDVHNENFAFMLLIGGFVASSLAFHDLSNSLKRYNYLTLPASTLEKFGSMWLLSSVGWVIFFTLIYTLYTLLVNALGSVIFSSVTFLTFDPLGSFSLTTIKYYLVLQGIFLVGAANFKGFVFPKTLALLVLFGLVAGVVSYAIMGDVLESGEQCLSQTNPLEGSLAYLLWTGLVWSFWWMLAPLTWVLTYLGLKEQEV